MDLHKFEQRLGIYRGTSLVGYGVIKCECVTFILTKTDLLVLHDVEMLRAFVVRLRNIRGIHALISRYLTRDAKSHPLGWGRVVSIFSGFSCFALGLGQISIKMCL